MEPPRRRAACTPSIGDRVGHLRVSSAPLSAVAARQTHLTTILQSCRVLSKHRIASQGMYFKAIRCLR